MSNSDWSSDGCSADSAQEQGVDDGGRNQGIGDVGVVALLLADVVHVFGPVALHHQVGGVGIDRADLERHPLGAGEVVVGNGDVTTLALVVVEQEIDRLIAVNEQIGRASCRERVCQYV